VHRPGQMSNLMRRSEGNPIHGLLSFIAHLAAAADVCFDRPLAPVLVSASLVPATMHGPALRMSGGREKPAESGAAVFHSPTELAASIRNCWRGAGRRAGRRSLDALDTIELLQLDHRRRGDLRFELLPWPYGDRSRGLRSSANIRETRALQAAAHVRRRRFAG